MPNYLRKPLTTSLDTNQRIAANRAVQKQSRGWPCSVVAINGSIVTVKFEVSTQWTLQNLEMPLFGPEYIRYPIQIGTKGYAMPADATLGNMSGLGPPSPPSVDQPPNVTSLVFMPIGNNGWSEPSDPNKIELYGPAGFIIHDTASNSVITGTTTEITITRGSTSITMDGSSITLSSSSKVEIDSPTIVLNGALQQGTGSTSYPATIQGPVTVVHELTANSIPVSTHRHGGVQSGSSETDPPSAT